MRQPIVQVGATELVYEIREIVKKAHIIQSLGVEIIWENIGDPVQKGVLIPEWIKKIVSDLSMQDMSYAYSSSKGLIETRKFLAERANQKNKTKITAEDILFFNGMGDAISHVYGRLKPESRVIGPSPAYSTHSSSEGAHAGVKPITYKLDPYNQWLPDIEDLRNKVKYNNYISGILVINPDNPTGMVYSPEVMQEIVNIAKEFDLFLICDEIYTNIVYNQKTATTLGEVIGDVCGISMKGISKELPWPGSRCGWLEFYNTDKDPEFAKFAIALEHAKMIEVSSTTLPQLAIPLVLSDARFEPHRKALNKEIEIRANYIYQELSTIKGIIANPTYGAFYTSIIFENGVLKQGQSLTINNQKVREVVDRFSQDASDDFKFVYELLGSTGICVVPISSFCADLMGFRITLLEQDFNKFKEIVNTIKLAILQYINS